MFGGNGGLLGVTIGNPKYPRGPGGLSGHGGYESPPSRFNDLLAKTMFTSPVYIFMQTQKFFFFGVCVLGLTPSTV